MMRTFSFRTAVLFTAVLALAAPAVAQTRVYVLTTGDYSLSPCPPECLGPRLQLINTVTGQPLATIPIDKVGVVATAVQASSNGTRLYVSTMNGHLYVVDGLAKRVIGSVDVGASGSDLAVLPDNSRAYVVNDST